MKVITSKIFKGKKMFLIDDENYQDGGSIIKAQKGLTTPKLLSTTKGIIIPTPNIDKFRTAYFTKGNPVIYDTKPDSNGKRYSFDNSITLHQNKFNGATVSKEMLTDLLDSADKIGIDRYKLLGLAGQESTLGHKNGSRFSQQGIVSGWTLDDHYDNYPKERFFADKKIPSTKVIKTNYGYDYDFDEKTVDNYLNNHPELITEYIKKLESIPKKPLEGINYFDEAAKNIKANEFNKYNPGDPDYTNKVNNSISFLKKDTVLSNFIKEYDLNKKTNSLKLNQQEIDKIIKQQEKKPIKVTSVGNIKPGGLIESQFQDGGVIEDNQGQWKYPGQITKINSNNITMKGVPYPVYGVSDIGDKQMMYPNGEYKFKGNSVTEYPILAQAGTTVKVLNTKVVNGQKQYLIENDSFIPSYANGGSIAELYTEKTGKDWSTAKTTGLTTGSYADNIKLKQRLLNGEFNFSPDFSSKLNKVISFTHKTFNEAFKVARQQLGANQIFEFQGKKYGTNLKGEKFEPTKEVLENAGMNTPLIKQNLYEQNKLVNSVYSLKKTVKLEPEYKDWEDVKKRQEEINKMDQSDIIKKYYKGSDEQYLIVDKARGKMHLMKGDKEIASYNVGTGENFGDEQTRTWVDKETKKTDWSKGNKQTGAGIYTVSNKTSKNPHYSNVPSWNFKNEYGIEVPMAIHAALQNRVSKINDKDETNNRVSNGCINGLCYDLEDLYTKGLKEGQKLYILPDDPNNKYEISNGKLVFKANSPNVNKSVNTLNYKPIKIEYAKSLKTDAPEAVEMAQSIVNNKQKLMKDLKINGDIYNELAKLTLGLAGQESKYGTSIKFKLKTEATQDLLKSITGNNSFNSKGLTQIKFDGVNEEVKKIFNKYGITKYNLNSGDKAALAQMILLSHMYNNELPAYRKYTKEKNISDMDALLYLNQGKRDELINKTATPDKNIYIQNVKKFANDFKIKQLN